jgi:uncharacterized circularly permuted ATP-grasp superfamily protein
VLLAQNPASRWSRVRHDGARQRRVKTLDGLARVDVIYRRVDGDYCDLELRPDSR